MKKTLIALVLIAVLCLSLAACTGAAKDPVTPEKTTAAPAPSYEAGSAGEKLASLGFAESDFLFAEDDYMEIDEDGDFDLYTSASYEQVARACYDACAKASDDGKVRDYWTEEEIEFSFTEDDFMIWFGYYRNGKFCDLALSETWADEATGVNQYYLQW